MIFSGSPFLNSLVEGVHKPLVHSDGAHGQSGLPFRPRVVTHRFAREPDKDDPVPLIVATNQLETRGRMTDNALYRILRLHFFLFHRFKTEFIPLAKWQRGPDLVEGDSGITEKLDLPNALWLILSEGPGREQSNR